MCLLDLELLARLERFGRFSTALAFLAVFCAALLDRGTVLARLDSVPRSAALPTIVPATPATNAPTGPPTNAPRIAPVVPPATFFRMWIRLSGLDEFVFIFSPEFAKGFGTRGSQNICVSRKI